MIIFKPINTLVKLVALMMFPIMVYILDILLIEPHVNIIISFVAFICVFIIRYRYYKKVNDKLLSNYIKEYIGDITTIEYFKKTVYAKRNKLSAKEHIYNDDLRQMPKILQAKNLRTKIVEKIVNNYYKMSILSPYMYKADFLNLVLVTDVKQSEFNGYIKAVKKEYLESSVENIVLFYIENPSRQEYQTIRRKLDVNNYITEDLNFKLTFLVKDENGFKLLSNYYFVDYSTDMIKDKYRIKSNIPIPCDAFTNRVNKEILYKLCCW